MMDNLILIIGCLLSFGLGAYVRQPFVFRGKQEEAEVTQAQADILAKEWANLLAFNGERQVD